MKFSETEEMGRMRTVDVRVAAQSLGRLVDQVRDSGHAALVKVIRCARRGLLKTSVIHRMNTATSA